MSTTEPVSPAGGGPVPAAAAGAVTPPTAVRRVAVAGLATAAVCVSLAWMRRREYV